MTDTTDDDAAFRDAFLDAWSTADWLFDEYESGDGMNSPIRCGILIKSMRDQMAELARMMEI